MNIRNLAGWFLKDCGLLPVAIEAAARASTILTGNQCCGDVGATKGDPDLGHHAIVTKADVQTQDSIIGYLASKLPQAYFIAEEKSGVGKGRMLAKGIRNGTPCVFGIDPLDGTAQYSRGLYEFSISIGFTEEGLHKGGVIFAPAVNGGLAVAGHRDLGIAMMTDMDGKIVHLGSGRTLIEQRPINESIVYVGPDIFFLKQFSRFLNRFSSKVRTTNCTGSCALGLALLAAGKIDALIEPASFPWDWFAGYPIVREAGGTFQFYHYRNGKIVPLGRPDALSYHADRRNTAFIAGNDEVVDWLFKILQKEWNRT